MAFASANKMISVTGARDGTGKSTLVSNLAVLLSAAGKKRVLVIELDPRHIGDLQMLLDKTQDRDDIASLLMGAGIMSQSFVRSSTAWSNVEILYLIQTEDKDCAVRELYALKEHMKSTYDYVLIDAGAADSVFAEASIKMCDHVIVVSLNDPMSITALRKYLKSSVLEHSKDSVAVVINRTEYSLTIQELEEMARVFRVHQVFCIRNDPKTIAKSLSLFRPVSMVSHCAPIARDLTQIAGMMQNGGGSISIVQQGKQLQSRWFGRLGRNGSSTAQSITPHALLDKTQVDTLKIRAHTRLLDELDTASFAIMRDDIDIDSEQGRELIGATIGAVIKQEAKGLHIQEKVKDQLVNELLDDLLGFGPIETYLRDDTITEIMVVGCKQIYIERGGRLEPVGGRFSSELQIRNVIERIISPLGRRIDESSPMVDARLPDGSRVNIVIPPLSLNGPLITIRKFPKEGFTVEQLITNGTLTQEIADYLYNAVVSRKNIIISGGTGSGKTTLLNILSGFVPRNERIVTIEDAAELQLDQEHVCSLEARPANIESKGEVTIRDLVKNALRMRPDRIIVGEVRGGEALDMLQAMNTGHTGSLTTCHANSTKDSLSRLEIMVLMAGMDLPVRAIQSQIASAIDVIIQVQRLEDGSRRVVEVAELKDLDERGFQLVSVY